MKNQFKTLLRDTQMLAMFLSSVTEKLIDRLETKMIDVDPGIVGQHVRPLKNNYFKV